MTLPSQPKGRWDALLQWVLQPEMLFPTASHRAEFKNFKLMSKYLLKCHIQTNLYKDIWFCASLSPSKAPLVDKPLRPVDHTTEKWSTRAVSTLETRKKTEEGVEKATGNCGYTEHSGFAYCQLTGSRWNFPERCKQTRITSDISKLWPPDRILRFLSSGSLSWWQEKGDTHGVICPSEPI